MKQRRLSGVAAKKQATLLFATDHIKQIKMFNLAVDTDPGWVRIVTDNFDDFLADHADCERKASAMVLNLIAKCPDEKSIIKPLIDLSLEELLHFRQVYELILKRGLSLNRRMHSDPYVNRLMSHCRSGLEHRLLDKMLVLAVVEARGAERFDIVAEALSDSELKSFYRNLYVAEKKHGSLFVRLCMKHFDESVVRHRLDQILEIEGRVIQSIEWRPSLH